MGLTSFLRSPRKKQIARLADEVASRSFTAVWERIERRAPSMRLSEARGYVRARAAHAVSRELNYVLSACDDATVADLAEEVRFAAMHHVVRLVFRDLVNLPPRVIQQRRAA